MEWADSSPSTSTRGRRSPPPDRCRLERKVGFGGGASLPRGAFLNLVRVYLHGNKGVKERTHCGQRCGQSGVAQSLVLTVIQPDNRACKEPKWWAMCVDLHVPTPLFPLFPLRKVLLSERKFSLFLSLLLVPFGLTEKCCVWLSGFLQTQESFWSSRGSICCREKQEHPWVLGEWAETSVWLHIESFDCYWKREAERRNRIT